MLSERSYWILLMAGFGVFAVVLIFWLIPYHIVEYNLGVNLLTSSIFMVFTVLFLSLITKAREGLRWKSVEEEVYETLGWHMKRILSQSTYLLEFPPELLRIKSLEDMKDWVRGYSKSLLVQAKYLSEKKPEEAKLSHVGENYLVDLGGLKDFDGFCRRELADIDMLMLQFERFWKPELVSSLMQLKIDLRGIVDLISVRKDFENYLSLIVLPIHAMIKDAYKTHNLGAKIPTE